MTIHIHPISALSDNYIWLLEQEGRVIIVDPGESEGVLAYIKLKNLIPEAIILTHKHDDHIGGVLDIVNRYPETPVYGPIETGHLATTVLKEGDSIQLFNQPFDVIKTADHIIDMGPEGGDGGGTVLATGTPEEVAAVEASYTGQFLKKILERDKARQS